MLVWQKKKTLLYIVFQLRVDVNRKYFHHYSNPNVNRKYFNRIYDFGSLSSISLGLFFPHCINLLKLTPKIFNLFYTTIMVIPFNKSARTYRYVQDECVYSQESNMEFKDFRFSIFYFSCNSQ